MTTIQQAWARFAARSNAVAPLVRQLDLLCFLCATVLVASLVLGGGTRGGFVSDTILQLLSIPLVWVGLWRVLELPTTPAIRWALGLAAAIALLPLIQLIPLPPRLWTALPSRDVSAATFDLLGRPLPWMPISVVPGATWLSATSLMPPLSIFVATVMLDLRQRRIISLIVIFAAVVSVFVGLLQVAQGPASPLRFFTITNPSEAVGFFANRNHFAALLYAALLFAVAWMIDIAAESGPRLPRYDVGAIARVIGGFVVLVILLSGQAMARSRAGVGLSIIALFGAFALAVSDRRTTAGLSSAKLLLGAIVLALVFATQFALYRFLERFEADPLEDARIAFARNTIAAAKAYMPVGAGLGSFVSVYGLFEPPQDTLANAFANHAHNDLLELWLETGVAGMVLLAAFMLWFAVQTWKIWSERVSGQSRDIDRLLARAATFVIALLIAHSLVDYPLRIGAMMAVLAFSCALLVRPPVEAKEPVIADMPRSKAAPARYRQAPQQAPVTATAASPQASGERHLQPRPSVARWGEGVAWPEAWRPAGTNKPLQTDENGS